MKKSPETFSSVGQWIKDAKDFGRSDISIVIVGNKTDLTVIFYMKNRIRDV